MVAKSTFLLILLTISFQSTKQGTIGANVTMSRMEDCITEQYNNMLLIFCSPEKSRAGTIVFIICDEPEVLNLYDSHGRYSNVEIIDVKKCSVPATNTIMPVNHTVATNYTFLVYRANVESSLRSTFFLGWEKLKVLFLRNNLITHLEHDVFESLSNIEMLYLKGNKLKNISRNLFSNLTNLEILDLSNNDLLTLEPDTFSNQQKMKVLYLHRNQLQNLKKEMFDGLTSLIDLDISFNNFKILRGDTFEHIPQLKSLHLYDEVNTIDIQEGLFKSNKHLSNFTIKASLSKLPTGILSHLPELTSVLISGIKLKNISGDLLNGSLNIEYCVLAESQINYLPSNLFFNQSAMLWLDLSFNEINNLEDGLFNDLTKLSTLWLHNNNLVNISGTIFSELKSLVEIGLENNKLVMIHCDAFTNTKHLEYIYVYNNELSFNECESKSPFRNLDELKLLNLTKNKITTISSDLKELPKLYWLSLDGNEISTLKLEDLQFKSESIKILLRNNSIRALQISDTFDEPNIFRKNVVHLYLTDKKFTLTREFYIKLQFQFQKLKHRLITYEYIDLTNLACNFPVSVITNEYFRLTSSNEKVYAYREMRCAVNKSKIKCPTHCECLMKVHSYDLTIDCSNSNLNFTPKFPNYKKLNIHTVELYIDHNNISVLDKLENLPPHLTQLDVSHNKITTLNEEAVNVLNKLKLKRISLGNNNWLCDCSSDAKNFVAFIEQNTEIIADKSDAIKCESKSGVWTELSIEYDHNCSQRLYSIYLIVITCFVFIIGTLITLYFKYQQEIKIWLYWHNLCLWWIDEGMLDMDKKYDAFISYSHRDVDFAVGTIVNDLENGNPSFKICVGERDWIAGETILDLITASVKVSRRTIVILTPSYLESVWGQHEFIHAHQQGIIEKRNRVIIIIYGDIGETESIDPTLRSYLNTNTYIKWGETWFWRKLRYALQHSYKARIV